MPLVARYRGKSIQIDLNNKEDLLTQTLERLRGNELAARFDRPVRQSLVLQTPPSSDVLAVSADRLLPRAGRLPPAAGPTRILAHAQAARVFSPPAMDQKPSARLRLAAPLLPESASVWRKRCDDAGRDPLGTGVASIAPQHVAAPKYEWGGSQRESFWEGEGAEVAGCAPRPSALR